MALELAKLDGRVELRELVGQGGMGEVHAAWDRSLARAVAVKFVRGSDPREAERLLLEARLQARVEHPHVVRVFEVGSLQGRPCVLFQLVRGKSLAELSPSLSLPDRVELVRQAATGLHAAHLQGLVHRDVKPGNILVEEGEEGRRTALVADFGLAHAEEGGLTRSGLLPGTLDFMAPEQLAGSGPIDFRSDVYALGATLYAALAGRPPFRIPSARPEGSDEQVKLLRRILDEEPPPLRSVFPELPRELSLVAQKAMEKEPAARYGSAEALADDLARFLRGEPVQARPTTLFDRAFKWARRNPTAAQALAASLAALLLAGGFTLWQARRASAEALEAARLGAVAASLESRMRMEYLSPPHDLRPALAAVRAEVEALRPLAARRGGGPASFALGKGLELLGDLDGARIAYERAWSLGFRTPQAAEGLGLALGRIFERERAQAEETLAPEALDRRLAALREELLVPARQALVGADRRGWHGPWIEASLALMVGDHEAAGLRAREALALEPGLYEARLLQGRALFRESVTLQGKAQSPQARGAIERAVDVLASSLEWGTSDPKALRAMAEAQLWRSDLLRKAGGDPGPAAEAALSWVERARALDPDEAWAIRFQGEVVAGQARFDQDAGRPGALARLREGVALMRRARDLGPRDRRTLAVLAHGLYTLGFRERQAGLPAEGTLDEGLEVYEAGLAVAPSDPLLRTYGIFLRLEKARLLAGAGKGSPEAFQQVIDAAEEELRRGTRFTSLVNEAISNAMVDRAHEQWRAGQDPRPGLAVALRFADGLAAEAPRSLAVRYNQAWVAGSAVDMLLAMGEDARTAAARALALAEETLRLRPELASLQLLKGETLLFEARRRIAEGEDPGEVLLEAERWILRSTREGVESSNLALVLATFHFVRATSRTLAGQDPSPALARAERILRGVTSRQPEGAAGFAGLALCAAERAAWARRRGRSAVDDAGRGLDQVASALRLDGRDPELRALKARLQALVGDRAAARAGLDAAYAQQPLLKGGREARAAEAELATAPRLDPRGPGGPR